jgi:hypothetical protein
MFYNGFNLLVDLVLAFIVYRLAFSAGFHAGYCERDAEITEDSERFADYYYEAQKEGER